MIAHGVLHLGRVAAVLAAVPGAEELDLAHLVAVAFQVLAEVVEPVDLTGLHLLDGGGITDAPAAAVVGIPNGEVRKAVLDAAGEEREPALGAVGEIE